MGVVGQVEPVVAPGDHGFDEFVAVLDGQLLVDGGQGFGHVGAPGVVLLLGFDAGMLQLGLAGPQVLAEGGHQGVLLVGRHLRK